MDELEFNKKINEITEKLKNLESDDQLKVLDYLSKNDLGQFNKVGDTSISKEALDDYADYGDRIVDKSDESWLRKSGGPASSFQERSLAARDKDRILTGGIAVGELLKNLALINKL
jgi:hypothetical protein|tara:strand:+ start:1237 stop:1584 length:348 start_codon:yes stop_codon:yes gene_type:complete